MIMGGEGRCGGGEEGGMGGGDVTVMERLTAMTEARRRAAVVMVVAKVVARVAVKAEVDSRGWRGARAGALWLRQGAHLWRSR